ncbi:MAG: glycosyltransferase family 2 protein [Microgenomates group bacterium]
MQPFISLLIIAKNSEGMVGKALKSVKELVDEIVFVDNGSTDKTIEIAKEFGARIFINKTNDLGQLRKFGLEKCQGEWVLVIDSDEVVSRPLYNEIKTLVKNKSKLNKFDGYFIPFQNHFLGKKLKYGGENYKKLIFFKKKVVKIGSALVHEKFELKNANPGELKNKIFHYSYRSLWQMYKKFTNYAIREANQKLKKGEKASLKKIFLYPLHMFYARFIEDKGYKDGILRIPLDLGFAYMEFLTYLILFLKSNIKMKKRLNL